MTKYRYYYASDALKFLKFTFESVKLSYKTIICEIKNCTLSKVV